MKAAAVIFFLLALIGCQFPLEEEHFVELPQTPRSEVEIDLSSIPDTLHLLAPVSVSYNLELKATPHLVVLLILEGTIYIVGESSSGAFTLDNRMIKLVKGYVPLEFVVITTTNTGSLADQSFRELQLFSLRKTLYVDNSPLISLTIDKAEVSNGSLFLSWKKYPQANLVGMKLIRLYHSGPLDLVENEIPLPLTATGFHDSTIVSEDVTYRLSLKNNIMLDFYAGPPKSLKFGASRVLSIAPAGIDKAKIVWNRSPLFGNIKSMTISNYLGTNILTTTNTIDTSAVVTYFAEYGRDETFGLKTVSKSNAVTVTVYTAVGFGKKIPLFDDVMTDGSGSFYFLRSPYLIKDNGIKRDSVQLTFDVLKPRCIRNDRLYLSQGNVVSEISTSTLAVLRTITVELDGVAAMFPKGDKLILIKKSVDYNKDVITVNLTTGAVESIYALPGPHFVTRLKGTPNEEYLVTEGLTTACVLRFNTVGAVTECHCFEGQSVAFRNNGRSILIGRYGMKSYSFPQLVLEANIEFPPFDYFDQEGGLILSSATKYTLFDLNTLAPIHRFNIDGDFSRLTGGTYFVRRQDIARSLIIEH